jgi:hypothetical protein
VAMKPAPPVMKICFPCSPYLFDITVLSER